MAKRTVGIGMLGYGFMAEAHMAGLRHVAQAHIAAVAGPRLERAKAVGAKYGAGAAYGSTEALLADPNVEAVVIASTDDAHYPQAMAAAAAGKHVFIEKPIALNARQAREIHAAIRAAGVRSAVGFTLRWNPLVRRLHTMIAAGDLGQILSVHAQRYNKRLLGPEPSMTWRFDPKRSGSGVIGDLGSHMIDLAQYLAGPIVEVSADVATFIKVARHAATGATIPLTLDDDSVLSMRFASGAHGTIATSRVGIVDSHLPLGRSSFQINGTQAGFLTDGILNASIHRLGREPETVDPGLPLDDADHAGILAFFGERMMDAFVRSILEGEDIAPTVVDGLRAQEVIEAALISARTRRWVDVRPVDG